MATNPFAKYKEKKGESPAHERKEPGKLQRFEKAKGMEKHKGAKKRPC